MITLNIKQVIGKWVWIIAVLLIVLGISGQIGEHMGKDFSSTCLMVFTLFFGMLLEEAKYFSKKDPVNTWTPRRTLRLYTFTVALATIVIGLFSLFSSN